MGMADEYEGLGLSEEELAAIREDDDEEGIHSDGGDDGTASDNQDSGSGEESQGEEGAASDGGGEGEGEEGDSKDEQGAGDDDGKSGDDDRDSDEGGEADDKKDAADDEDLKTAPRGPSYGPLVDIEASKARIEEINEELKTLQAKYDDADIEPEAFARQRESLLREQTKIEAKVEMAEDFQRATIQANWKAAQDHYLSIHPEISEDPNILTLFATKVNGILTSETGASMDDYDILKAAYKEIAYLIPKGKQESREDERNDLINKAKGEDADQSRKGAPKTLRNVSASGDNDEGGRFAHLDELSGEALEKALEKMSEEERQAWLNEQ